jgi:hypothetical protein
MTEPFAWFRYQWGDRVYHDSKKWDDCQPLYAHPKEWVGLTDEEIIEIFNTTTLRAQAIQMTEAKLKEKNT